MSTIAQTLTDFCGRLAEERSALVEKLALSSERIDPSDLTRMAQLQTAVMAAEAVLATHLPKLGSGSEA